jgi:hypothetical protein
MNILRSSTLSLTLAIAIITLSYANLSSAETPGGRGFGRLFNPGPGPGSWISNHYSNLAGQVDGGPVNDDSAEVIFVGTIAGIGKVTVEQSTAFTFATVGAEGAALCGLVYNSPRTLVRIHTHADVSTQDVTAPLTLIPGSLVNDPGGTTEFPFTADGKGANFLTTGLDVGTHTLTGTFTVTREDGATITGIVEGGSICIVETFFTEFGHPPAGVFDFPHDDFDVTVQTALEIMDGTGEFAGASGTGVLVYSFDTFDPHGLLDAHIVLDLDR